MKTEVAVVVDQVHVQGRYEPLFTDTAQLAWELSQPQKFDRLATDFDAGFTPLRDVGDMITAQRDAILAAYENRTLGDLAASNFELLSTPVANLHDRLVNGQQDQSIGHNFFVNATGFIDAGLPWAVNLNNLITARTGTSIYQIAVANGPGDYAGKDKVLAALTERPDAQMTASLAVYLAGRSREGERYLESQYGRTLEQTKGLAFATIQEVARTTGLPVDMVERAAQQIRRTTFGSFDHLQGLVTSDNSGAAGDYRIGSLRLEVQFEGNVRDARNRSQAEAQGVIAHELQHAASAQSEGRCGLQVRGRGLEANEGMTEYLSQLSLGQPGFVRSPNGTTRVLGTVPYKAPVFAKLALHEQFKLGHNRHFAVLFNAYHGDIRSQQQVEEALDAFYRLDNSIAQQLG